MQHLMLQLGMDLSYEKLRILLHKLTSTISKFVSMSTNYDCFLQSNLGIVSAIVFEHDATLYNFK